METLAGSDVHSISEKDCTLVHLDLLPKPTATPKAPMISIGQRQEAQRPGALMTGSVVKATLDNPNMQHRSNQELKALVGRPDVACELASDISRKLDQERQSSL